MSTRVEPDGACTNRRGPLLRAPIGCYSVLSPVQRTAAAPGPGSQRPDSADGHREAAGLADALDAGAAAGRVRVALGERTAVAAGAVVVEQAAVDVHRAGAAGEPDAAPPGAEHRPQLALQQTWPPPQVAAPQSPPTCRRRRRRAGVAPPGRVPSRRCPPRIPGPTPPGAAPARSTRPHRCPRRRRRPHPATAGPGEPIRVRGGGTAGDRCDEWPSLQREGSASSGVSPVHQDENGAEAAARQRRRAHLRTTPPKQQLFR